MHLKMRHLQSVVEQTEKHEKFLDTFCKELCEALGPAVVVSRRNSAILKAADEYLDILESTGKITSIRRPKMSTLLEAAKSTNETVRKLSVRLLPTNRINHFLSDPSYSVKYAAAKRLPKSLVNEVAKARKDRKLLEISNMVTGEEMPIPSGDVVKTSLTVNSMSDAWYDRQARKLCKEYGRNLEGQWEEKAVSLFCNAYFVTSGVKLDKDKLLSRVLGNLQDREEAVIKDLGESYFRTISKKLIAESAEYETEKLSIVEETVSPYQNLLNSNLSSSEYIRRFEEIANVSKTSRHSVINSHFLTEGKMVNVEIPVTAKVSCKEISNEKAINAYVKHWNRYHEMNNVPFVLSWYPQPHSSKNVNFNVELK